MVSRNPTYLTLNDRLSQIWLNKYTLVLVLAAFKILLFSNSVKNALHIIKDYINSNCSVIDSIYSKTMNDTPHYLGVMGNYLMEEAMIQSVKTSLTTLSLLVYASEELLRFMIDLYLGTFECLLVSTVDGAVDVATNTTEKLLGLVNSSVNAIANDLDDGLDDLSKIMNKVISAADKIESFFEGDDDDDSSSQVKHVNLTINSLRNLYIPGSINDKLKEISAATPSFSKVKNSTKNLISVPFEKIRNEMKSINATQIVGDPELLYVPPLEAVSNSSGICSNNKNHISSFFNSASHCLNIVTIICIVMLLVAAMFALVPEWWSEYRLWSRMCAMRDTYWYNREFYSSSEDDSLHKEASNPFKDTIESKEDEYDIIASYQSCFHPWNTRLRNAVNKILVWTNITKSDDLIKGKRSEWVIAYIVSERALFILGVGLLGLLICILQFTILAFLQKELNNNSNESIESISNSSTWKTLGTDMDEWAKRANIYINSTEANLNDKLFGWVDTATISVNDTINTIITDIDDTLADIFNGTLLYNPMKTVVGCIIENKLYTIEHALTWIHDKSHISLPIINPTDIQKQISFNNNSTKGKDSQIMEKILNDSYKAIQKILTLYHKIAIQELTIALVLIFIWFIQLPIALIAVRFKKF